MIDKILYVNLNRRPDRNEWFLKNMENAGAPMEIVKVFPAHDWINCGKMSKKEVSSPKIALHKKLRITVNLERVVFDFSDKQFEGFDTPN